MHLTLRRSYVRNLINNSHNCNGSELHFPSEELKMLSAHDDDDDGKMCPVAAHSPDFFHYWHRKILMLRLNQQSQPAFHLSDATSVHNTWVECSPHPEIVMTAPLDLELTANEDEQREEEMKKKIVYCFNYNVKMWSGHERPLQNCSTPTTMWNTAKKNAVVNYYLRVCNEITYKSGDEKNSNSRSWKFIKHEAAAIARQRK